VAYLKNENGEIIVDAILTKYGRDKLSKQGNLGITKFALSDDEIDYSLYNTSNPNGSEYYDIAIRELPVLEALPSDDISMKYHLFTDTNQNVSTISSLTVNYPDILNKGISTLNVPYAITPNLTPLPNNWKDIYYVAQLIDTVGAVYEFKGVINPEIGKTNQILIAEQNFANLSSKTANAVNTIYAVGHSFTFTLKSLPRYTRVFPVKITAYGPVSTNVFTFNIVVKGIYSSLVANESQV